MTQKDLPATIPLNDVDWLAPLEEPSVVFHESPRYQQAAVVRTIGARLREARELCNLSLSTAAKQLGYANPSKLSKVELATDTNSVPLWLILRAARAYEVSVDYLFGITDDWGVRGPHGTQGWLLDAWEKMRRRDLAQIDRLHYEVVTVATHVTTMVEGGRAAVQAMDTYRARNPVFDESPASSMLLHRIDRLRQLGASTEAALAKLRITLPRHDNPIARGGADGR